MSIRYSIVAPVFNEEGALLELHRQLRKALDGLCEEFEILLIDDGSQDRSRSIIEDLVQKDPSVRAVFLDRNRGQSTALVAGFRCARGEFIITLDADLQNDPADIPRMLLLLDSADVVNGIREKRCDSFVRRISSSVGNRFRNWLTAENISDVGCSLRVIRASYLQDIPVFDGMHRFLPSLLRMNGARIVEIPVAHRPRHSGVPKYGVLDRLFVGFIDVLGVRWLKSRNLEYHATYGEHDGTGAKPLDPSPFSDS